MVPVRRARRQADCTGLHPNPSSAGRFTTVGSSSDGLGLGCRDEQRKNFAFKANGVAKRISPHLAHNPFESTQGTTPPGPNVRMPRNEDRSRVCFSCPAFLVVNQRCILCALQALQGPCSEKVRWGAKIAASVQRPTDRAARIDLGSAPNRPRLDSRSTPTCPLPDRRATPRPRNALGSMWGLPRIDPGRDQNETESTPIPDEIDPRIGPTSIPIRSRHDDESIPDRHRIDTESAPDRPRAGPRSNPPSTADRFHFDPASADFGRAQANLVWVELGPTLVVAGPDWAEIGRLRPQVGRTRTQTWPIAGQGGPLSEDAVPDLGRSRPYLLPGLGQISASCRGGARRRPTRLIRGPCQAPSGPVLARSMPTLGPHAPGHTKPRSVIEPARTMQRRYRVGRTREETRAPQ